MGKKDHKNAINEVMKILDDVQEEFFGDFLIERLIGLIRSKIEKIKYNVRRDEWHV